MSTMTKSNLLKQISYWGVTPDLDPVFAKRVILTNLLGLLFTINMSVSAVAFLYFGQYKLALFTCFFVLTELAWPLLNYFRKYNLSRVGLLVSSNFLGFTVSVLLPDTGYNRGFYVMAGIPILLFGLKEKWFILLGFLLPVILYPVSDWAQHAYGLDLSPWVKEIIYFSIGIIYVTLIFIMFYFLSSQSAIAEEKLKVALRNVEEEKAKIENLNYQLEQQRARAFSSAKFAALGEMASGIGHEINNPMTIIALKGEQLKHMIDSDAPRQEIHERISQINHTVKRVASIIDSMRTFSREADDDAFKEESLKKIIDDTLTFCRERFKHHDIKLNVEFPEGDISSFCRPVQISQVLLNLLNNAFDALEDLPEKWINVKVYRKHSKVLITVTDSGVGIPDTERERIFQPFYTTKPVGKGTGLGLSLSRKIVIDHGGQLYVDASDFNTKFVIELKG